jgi:hypothetical protein
MLHAAPRSLRLRGAAATLALIALAAFPLGATARTTVDPSTLTPTPNPAGNPVCGWTGSQIQCLADRSFTVTDADTGISCAGGELLETSQRHIHRHYYYNADRLLTSTITQEWVDGILYVKETGQLVRWTDTDTGIQSLSVPGDNSTGVGINSGANLHFYPASGGSVLIAGRTIENFDTGAFFQVGSNPNGVDICALIA